MRKWLLALSIAGLMTVSLIGIFLLEERGIGVRVISEKKARKIEEQLNQQSETMEFDLMFAGEALAYDATGKTFFLPLSLESEQWENGRIEATQGIEIWFLSDFTKENKLALISQNSSIPFYAVSKDGYAKYNLKLTGLPVLSFQGTECMTENGEILYELSLYDVNHESDWVTRCLTTSTLRGNTSLTYEKKSLRLKLKEQTKEGTYKKKNVNFLGIREDDDWILNSLYADNTRIRDKLAMELWQEVGAYQNPYGKNFGVTGEYVEVLINDGYAGLYLLTHPIDRKQLGMDSVSSQIAAGENVVERIYKKKYTAPWDEEAFLGPLPDANQIDYRGGFYLKGDKVLGNEQEWEPLRRLAACIESEDVMFAEQIAEMTDSSNVIDNWLFFQAIAGFDNENKNVYYIARRQGDLTKGYFIPWDLNICFGAVYADNPFYCEETMEEVETVVAFQPGMRMIEQDVEGARAQAFDRWKEWRAGAFSTEQIYERMDTLMNSLVNSGAMQREMDRWQNGNASPDLAFMKEFTAKRMEFLDDYLNDFTK